MTDSFYQGSARFNSSSFRRPGTPANTSKRLEEEWKLKKDVADEANKSYQWVSGLRTADENKWLNWANKMGKHEADAISKLSTTISKALETTVSKAYLKHYSDSIDRGIQEAIEKGNTDFSLETGVYGDQYLNATKDIELSKAADKVRRIHGDDLADYLKNANEGERLGVKIAIAHQHRDRLPLLLEQAKAGEQQLGQDAPEYNYLNPQTGEIEKYSVHDIEENSVYDAHWHHHQRQRFQLEAALAIPGKPLSANMMVLAYGRKAYESTESIVKQNKINRGARRAGVNITGIEAELRNAYQNPGTTPRDKIFSGIFVRLAPELSRIPGTNKDSKDQLVRARQHVLKFLKDEIAQSQNPYETAVQIAEMLGEAKLDHPAGKKLAMELFGNEWSPLAIQEYGLEKQTEKQNLIMRAEQSNANFDMKGPEGIFAAMTADAANGEPWSEERIEAAKAKLKMKYSFAHHDIDTAFDHFTAPKMGLAESRRRLAALGKTNHGQFTPADLQPIAPQAIEDYQAINPNKFRRVDNYLGHDAPDLVKQLPKWMDRFVSERRTGKYIEGDKSGWHSNDFSFRTLLNEKFWEKAIDLQNDTDYNPPDRPRSSQEILNRAWGLTIDEVNLANSDKAPDDKHWSYFTMTQGHKNAHEIITGKTVPTETENIVEQAYKQKDKTKAWIMKNSQLPSNPKYFIKGDYDGDGDQEIHPTTELLWKRTGKLKGIPLNKWLAKERNLGIVNRILEGGDNWEASDGDVDIGLKDTVVDFMGQTDGKASTFLPDNEAERRLLDYDQPSAVLTKRANHRIYQKAGQIDPAYVKDILAAQGIPHDDSLHDLIEKAWNAHPEDVELQLQTLMTSLGVPLEDLRQSSVIDAYSILYK